MPLKEKYYSKIKEIIDEIGLYNKGDYSTPKDYLLKSPKICLSELLIKYERKEITDEEISSFLQDRLNLSKEKTEKLKTILSEKLLNSLEESVIANDKPGKNKKSTEDRYREPIE